MEDITERIKNDVNEKLISEIRTTFKSYEERLFVASFYYCLMNDNKFVIDFNDTWTWCGFIEKNKAKILLNDNFKENIDYIIEKKKENERILLTTQAFKNFCIKTDTIKSDEIYDYFVKLEEIIHKSVKMSYILFKEACAKSDIEISHQENSLIDNFNETPLVYIGYIEPKVIKFGVSNDIYTTVYQNKLEIGPSFVLEYVIVTKYNKELEHLIKKQFATMDKEYIFNGKKKKQTELIQLSEQFTINGFYDSLFDIKKSIDDGLILKIIDEKIQLDIENENLLLKIKTLETKLLNLQLEKN
jgi:hypothetical protein